MDPLPPLPPPAALAGAHPVFLGMLANIAAARNGGEVVEPQAIVDAAMNNLDLGLECGLPVLNDINPRLTFLADVLNGYGSRGYKFSPAYCLKVRFGDGTVMDSRTARSGNDGFLADVKACAERKFVEQGGNLEDLTIDWEPLFRVVYGGAPALRKGEEMGYPIGWPVIEYSAANGTSLLVNIWDPRNGYRSCSHLEATSRIEGMSIYDVRCPRLTERLNLATQMGLGRSGWQARPQSQRGHYFTPPVHGATLITSLTEALIVEGVIYSEDHIRGCLRSLQSDIADMQAMDSIVVALSPDGNLRYEIKTYAASVDSANVLGEQIGTKLASVEARRDMSAVVIDIATATGGAIARALVPSRGNFFTSHTLGAVTTRPRVPGTADARPDVEVLISGKFSTSVASFSNLNEWEMEEARDCIEHVISNYLYDDRANLLSVVEVTDAVLYESIAAHATAGGMEWYAAREERRRLQGFSRFLVASGVNVGKLKTMTSYLKSVPAMSALASHYVGQNAGDEIVSFAKECEVLSKLDYMEFRAECIRNNGESGTTWGVIE